MAVTETESQALRHRIVVLDECLRIATDALVFCANPVTRQAMRAINERLRDARVESASRAQGK